MVDFTKEEGEEARECLSEIMDDFSDSQAAEFFPHCNHLDLFLQAAIEEAPSEEEE